MARLGSTLSPPRHSVATALQVGVLKARQLAAAYRLPLVAVHHMEAHALVARLGATQFALEAAAAEAQGEGQAAARAADDAAEAATTMTEPAITAAAATAVEFPFLCLLISGGHNLLLMVEGVGQYVQLGTTLDDALGE